MKKLIPALALLAFIATACGGQPAEPTLSPDEVQGTAVSAAFTMVAQTQAAIPTNTPLPPTDTPVPTPLPTDTPLPTPTVDFALLPTATQVASSGGGNNCDGVLNTNEAGPQTNVRFDNKSGFNAYLSVYMYQKNKFGQCGSYSGNPIYIANKATSGPIALPNGDYYVFAYLYDKNNQPKVGVEGYFTNTVDTHIEVLIITKDNIH